MSTAFETTDATAYLGPVSVQKGGSICITVRNTVTASGDGTSTLEQSEDGGQTWQPSSYSALSDETMVAEFDYEKDWDLVIWDVPKDMKFRVLFTLTPLGGGDAITARAVFSVAAPAAAGQKSIISVLYADQNTDIGVNDCLQNASILGQIGSNMILDTETEYVISKNYMMQKGRVIARPGIDYIVSFGVLSAGFALADGSVIMILSNGATAIAAASINSGATAANGSMPPFLNRPNGFPYRVGAVYQTDLDSIGSAGYGAGLLIQEV
jgi:hypothetical protein